MRPITGTARTILGTWTESQQFVYPQCSSYSRCVSQRELTFWNMLGLYFLCTLVYSWCNECNHGNFMWINWRRWKGKQRPVDCNHLFSWNNFIMQPDFDTSCNLWLDRRFFQVFAIAVITYENKISWNKNKQQYSHYLKQS